MRTLKRTLCLVLAMVMVLGMFGIASAASFKDDDKIQYDAAVGVMTGIGAINGMGDGTFNPAGNVTRAQAAKMVAYAVLGADVAKTLPVSASSFKDVDSNYAWAIPSIEYLVKVGVINGRGNGTFDPEGKVTAYEIAKMLLCAAGYGKKGEFTGNSWALNVAITAQKQGIFTDSKATDRNAAATREECALYCYNGITGVDQVYYDKDKETYLPTGKEEIAKQVYGIDSDACTLTGVIVANSANDPSLKANATAKLVERTTLADVFAADLATDAMDAANLTLNFQSTMAQLGDYVEVYYGTMSGKKVVYYVDTLSTKVTTKANTTAAGFKNLVGATTVFEDGGDDLSFVTFTNFKATQAANSNVVGTFVPAAAGSDTYVIYKKQIIAEIKAPAYSVEKVTAVSTTAGAETITFSSTGTLQNNSTSDVVAEYEGIAKGDEVTITKVGSNYSVQKNHTVEGTVSKTDGTTLTVSGKDYKATPAPFDKLTTIVDDTVNFKDTFTLKLDAYGMYYAVKNNTNAANTSLYYVVGKYTSTASSNYGNTSTQMIQCVNLAGTEFNFCVVADGYATSDVNYSDIAVGEVYEAREVVDPTTGAKLAVIKTPAEVVVDTAPDKTDITTKTPAFVSSTGKNLFASADMDFLYVTGTKASLKAESVKGMQNARLVKTAGKLLDGATDATTPEHWKTAGTYLTAGHKIVAAKVGTTNNYNIIGIFQVGSNIAAGSGVIYVPSATPSTTTVPAGTKTAFVQTYYIDGVKNENVLTTVDKADVGFYTYTVDKDGIYTLTLLNNNANGGSIANDYVANYYNGIFTTITDPSDSSTATSMLASYAKLVDLTTEAKDRATALTLEDLVADGAIAKVAVSYKIVDNNKVATAIYILEYSKISITAQPAAATVSTGYSAGAATFSVTASVAPTETLGYKWQYLKAGTTWEDCGATQGTDVDTSTMSVAAGLTGTTSFRCIITGTTSHATITSNVVTFTVTAS